MAGKVAQNSNSLHNTDFLRAYVKLPTNNYSPTPAFKDYLTVSLREGTTRCSRCREPSNKEVCDACMRKSTNSELSPNASYTRTGNYDIASKLGLYNPATSFTVNQYSPQRNSYQK